jgi:2-(1,2-epoxy-1,2-dihydrophenyl)acetyl-CoA isomerase
MTDIDTGTPDLLGRIDEGVAVLTMNRPERRNALSDDMLAALAHTLEAVEVDDAVGCVVLTGAGGAFCAGGDVKAMAEGASRPGRSTFDGAVAEQRRSHRATSGRLYQMAKPTIAAIPGPAARAGLSLALACDLRYAAERAVLTTAFARVGYSGDYGGTWFLTHLVGSGKARELYYLSERLSATEAERLGIVNAVFPDDDLEEQVIRRARSLAAGPRVALGYMKENLNRAVRADLGDCLDLEATHHLRTGQTEDHREAAQAFVDKREPRFSGR